MTIVEVEISADRGAGLVVFGSADDLAIDIAPNDPDCPIKGLPSIRFDMRLSRESAADRIGGRVGADPSAIPQAPARTGNGHSPTPAAAAGG